MIDAKTATMATVAKRWQMAAQIPRCGLTARRKRRSRGETLLCVHAIATLAMEVRTHDEYCNERLYGELKRRISAYTVLPSTETTTLFCGLLASGQIML